MKVSGGRIQPEMVRISAFLILYLVLGSPFLDRVLIMNCDSDIVLWLPLSNERNRSWNPMSPKKSKKNLRNVNDFDFPHAQVAKDAPSHLVKAWTEFLTSRCRGAHLGPPVVPFLTVSFLGKGSPTKIDYRKRVPLF